MNRIFPVMSTLFILVLAGCQRPVAGPPVASKPAANLVRVSVVQPEPASAPRTTTQPATIHAYFEARVLAKAAGYLSELKVDIGTSVEQGDVLAVIALPELEKQRDAKLATIAHLQAEEKYSDSQLQIAQAKEQSFQAKLAKAVAEVKRAEAELVANQVQLGRVTDLVQQQAVADRLQDEAQKKFDMAEAAKVASDASVTSAEAEVNLAKAEVSAAQAGVSVAAAMTAVARSQLEELDELLKYATLSAPFAGVVIQRNVEPGDLVRNAQTSAAHVGQPLFVVANTSRVRVRVHLAERDVPLADVGDPVAVSLQSLPGRTFRGQIDRVAGALDEQTRTMLVEIDLANEDGLLRPGMFGQATVTLAPAADVVALPARAVRYDDKGNSYVYLLNESDEVEVIDVVTGFDNGHEIEISSGVDTTSRVVGPLIDRLKPGQKVKVDS